MELLEQLTPLVCFIFGMAFQYWLNNKSMTATMRLAYKIRANMPYEDYEEIEQTETE